ncbi:Xaa-Pro peptidase family protein [Notoacmeibacter sp. MSK16QG-6]|uniref:M24 family metallopeptidase n=1 Tax=Notoacmeibacter sp. MSK16QG-6 TaxID=2957982 RepID=UPI00209FA998|nr:Xaa-Pro peptidase family protein [Notoacmeibacter sp. MSK16QG-6]MCP1200538.1 Xaa-Pro peptidase family protein [Notoacmeibacter sp. MSK16QG-6]
MDEVESMLSLAQAVRDKVFAALPADAELVVSCDPLNKAYLSGYVSIAHDLAPAYRSAVLATRGTAALVTSAADAAPAFEALGRAELIHRYGEFYFDREESTLDALTQPAPALFEVAFTAALATHKGQGRIGIDRSDDDLLWRLCTEIFGESRILDVTQQLQACRAVKLPGEVARLRQAAECVEAGFAKIMQTARAGMTELDLAAMIAESIVAGGGVPRFVSVTSGPRSALADAYPTGRTIAQEETIRIDAGCTHNGYWSDIGRTLVFGSPGQRQSDIYGALLRGLEAMLDQLKEGVVARDLFEIAVGTVRTNGIPSYRRQHCGHGIGLRSYDSPTVAAHDDTVLMAGMCLCLETPYYILGCDGMMVEETVMVTPDGFEPITTLSREFLSI